MEAMCSYETSVDFQQTTRRYVSEDSTLHVIFMLKIFRNLSSYIIEAIIAMMHALSQVRQGLHFYNIKVRVLKLEYCHEYHGTESFKIMYFWAVNWYSLFIIWSSPPLLLVHVKSAVPMQ
jgi:hypothetical protein